MVFFPLLNRKSSEPNTYGMAAVCIILACPSGPLRPQIGAGHSFSWEGS